MWSTPWSWGKILFILNRYMPFINIPMALNLRRVTTPEMCFQHYRVITWVMFWSMIFSEQVLLLRTVAIWGRQRWIIIFLLCLHIATIVPSIVTTSLFFRSLTYVPINENRYGCKVGESTNTIMVSFVMLLISETSTSFTFYAYSFVVYLFDNSSQS
ncbi:hypothetical protein BDQ12DRAFT_266240 [Crucibulum laeve]|uniref:G-protein coupled receptors family 1 profile domain-containing protein n=1 Tax=Crucibulum laeve TaxID=68775 RepID=A0A5C3LSV8_9AGAR|nr:hypothetical protein BDQ12DRAFT_266240 [Crucibulum laeve]